MHLSLFYKISVDWNGDNYCGLTTNWNYKEGYVDVGMPGYVKNQLQQYQHPRPQQAQFAPHKWSVSSYGKSS